MKLASDLCASREFAAWRYHDVEDAGAEALLYLIRQLDRGKLRPATSAYRYCRLAAARLMHRHLRKEKRREGIASLATAGDAAGAVDYRFLQRD